jgi:hypothetical protein
LAHLGVSIGSFNYEADSTQNQPEMLVRPIFTS